jgi:uncharacterized protein
MRGRVFLVAMAAALALAGAARSEGFPGCNLVRPDARPLPGPEAYPWKGAEVVDGAQIKAPKDLDRYAGKAIIVREANLAGADFSGAKLSNVCFAGGDLSGVRWGGSENRQLAFVGVNLKGASLRGARFEHSRFSAVQLDNVDARSAVLTGSIIDPHSMGGLDLRFADLTDALVWCGIYSGEACDWGDQDKDRDVDARGALFVRATLHLGLNWLMEGAYLQDAAVPLRDVDRLRQARVVGSITLNARDHGPVPATLTASELRDLLGHWRAKGPSFDCSDARTPVERRLCWPGQFGYWPLASKDAALDRAYAEALAAHAVEPSEQQRWLASRDRCLAPTENDPDKCLEALYDARLDELGRRLATSAWFKPGAKAVFLYGDIPVDEAFRSTPLYRKLLPVIAADARNAVIVEVIDAEHVQARGWGVGGNGHSCSLDSQEPFRLDPKTGWFGGPRQQRKDDKRTWEDVIRFEGRHALVNDQDDSDHVTCGARADFKSWLTLAPITAEELDAWAPGR